MIAKLSKREKNLSILIAAELQPSSTTWDIVEGFKDNGVKNLNLFNSIYLIKLSNLDQKFGLKKKVFTKISKFLFYISIYYKLIKYKHINFILFEKPRLINNRFLNLLKKRNIFFISFKLFINFECSKIL